MKILMRVDAGGDVGLGHFFRSLNLAMHLQKRGHEILFLHKPSRFWEEAAKKHHLNHSCLQPEDSDKQTLELVAKEKFNVFYVDAILNFAEETVKNIKKFSKTVFYQNISDSRHLADIFISPSFYLPESFFDVFGQNTIVYRGLKYLMMHPDVEPISSRVPSEKEGRVKSIAVISGGSDPKNVLLRIFDLIQYTNFEGVDFVFYYGEDYLFKGKIPKKLPSICCFKKFNHHDIAGHDLLISTFGVSVYEFMSLGMPIISVGHQDSNTKASQILAERTGAIYHLGCIDDIDCQSLNSAIKTLVSNPEMRMGLVARARSHIDFYGVDRVVKIIEECIR